MATPLDPTRSLVMRLRAWGSAYWLGVGRVAERHAAPSEPAWMHDIRDFLREAR